MNSEDIATKGDIKNLKDELTQLISSQKERELPKQGMTSKEVKKALGISFGLINTLRLNNTLSAQKVAGTWIYNYDQVMACIPDYKKKD